MQVVMDSWEEIMPYAEALKKFKNKRACNIYCPKCGHFVSAHSDYLHDEFHDETYTYWAAILVTHYRLFPITMQVGKIGDIERKILNTKIMIHSKN